MDCEATEGTDEEDLKKALPQLLVLASRAYFLLAVVTNDLDLLVHRLRRLGRLLGDGWPLLGFLAFLLASSLAS
jgi:hypothetical protein